MVGVYTTRYQLLADPDANTCNAFWGRGHSLVLGGRGGRSWQLPLLLTASLPCKSW